MTIHAAPSDYYDVLGVDRRATSQQIKAAFWRKAKQLHPDRNRSIHATDDFVLLGEAYRVLRDSERRRQFDDYCRAFDLATLRPGRTAWTSSRVAAVVVAAVLVAGCLLTVARSDRDAAMIASEVVTTPLDAIATNLESLDESTSPDVIALMASSSKEAPALVGLFALGEATRLAKAQPVRAESSVSWRDDGARQADDWSRYAAVRNLTSARDVVGATPEATNLHKAALVTSGHTARPISRVRHASHGKKLVRHGIAHKRWVRAHRRRYAAAHGAR